MGTTSNALTGPDFAAGIELEGLRDGQPTLGHALGEAVVLVRQGATCFAVGATCTHYSGPLGEGLVVDGTIRCPWHHARFDLESGRPRGGPGINPLPCFDLVTEGSLVRVTGKRTPVSPSAQPSGPKSVVIVGSGPAGAVVADTLRAEGYAGLVTLVGEEGIPVDRPNLSKDYLAGTAPEEWLPLRDEAALAEKRITLVNSRATSLDLSGRRVTLADGTSLAYGALVLATGASPIRPAIPGADGENVLVLRTLADSRRIIEAATAKGARRAVVVGGGFIGIEAAGALATRKLETTLVLREGVPLGNVLGEKLGRFVEELHTEHGVRFVRGAVQAIDAEGVTLAGGTRLPADLVVVGVGVRPNVELAQAAGLRVDDGIVVDQHLRTSDPGVFAVGDVARFPYGPEGRLHRVEHFVHAERMGFCAARTLLGHEEPFRMAPFFWSQHYDVPIAYVGSGPWDAVEVIGDPNKRDVLAVYRRQGRPVALASIYRDIESLRFEALLEAGDEAGIEALFAGARG